MKSGTMEVLKIEMEKGASFGTSFEHRGEEFHYVISGVVEYQIEDNVYQLEAGDSLWHKSRLRHTARNVGDDKAVFIDVITPPSFM
jgi:quercetin dioxygenase-like cupin family protein